MVKIRKFAIELKRFHHAYRHDIVTDEVEQKRKELIQKFSELDTINKARIFYATKLYGSTNGIWYDPFNRLNFTLQDMLEFWIWLIRDGKLDVFKYHQRKQKSFRKSTNETTEMEFRLPLYKIICCDLDVTKPDSGFGDLFHLIFENASTNQVFAEYEISTREKNEKMTILDMLIDESGYPRIHVHCLRAFISVLERIAVSNPLLVRKYVNRSCFPDKNYLLELSNSSHFDILHDEFKRLHRLGADLSNVQRNGWNVVSYAMSIPEILKYLLEQGYRPTNQYVMDDFAIKLIQKGELDKHWNNVYSSCLNLTPQMYPIWDLATRVNSKYQPSRPEEIKRKHEEVQKYGDTIVQSLELYEKYAPDYIDYKHLSTTGHSMLDYAILSGHEKLIDFIRTKTESMMQD